MDKRIVNKRSFGGRAGRGLGQGKLPRKGYSSILTVRMANVSEFRDEKVHSVSYMHINTYQEFTMSTLIPDSSQQPNKLNLF